MKPGLRKFALTVHVAVSVGWLGAVMAYAALAVTGLTSRDVELVRAAYLSMEVLGWYVIVPCSVATILVGLWESLGTSWGLFRHWWIAVKFVLTSGAALVLLAHMEAVRRMADVAAGARFAVADSRTLRIQLAVHAAGGLVVLLAALAISVFKPWGAIAFRRAQNQPRSDVAPAVLPARARSGAGSRSASGTPRWVLVVGIHVAGLLLLALVFHLAAGGMPRH